MLYLRPRDGDTTIGSLCLWHWVGKRLHGIGGGCEGGDRRSGLVTAHGGISPHLERVSRVRLQTGCDDRGSRSHVAQHHLAISIIQFVGILSGATHRLPVEGKRTDRLVALYHGRRFQLCLDHIIAAARCKSCGQEERCHQQQPHLAYVEYLLFHNSIRLSLSILFFDSTEE